MDRRRLLKLGFGAGSWGLLNGLSPLARAGEPMPRLVVVMLRGGIDGLNVVVPYAEDNYYQLRGDIAIPRAGADKGAIDLDGHFGLHPALASMMPLWKSRKLAFVHAVGSPDPTLSHFDAQNYIESGTPGRKATPDGWMNRLLAQLQPADAALDAVSMGATLPRIFAGTQSVANIPIGRDTLPSLWTDRPEVRALYDQLYAGSADLGPVYRQGRDSREQILAEIRSDAVSPEAAVADNGAPLPGGFARDTTQLAALIHRNPGMRLAFMQLGGWDTHIGQGGSEGILARRLKGLGDGLAALSDQLDSEFGNTVVVVISEFGRTARQNGSHGTDHGRGNVIWVLGGKVNGGKVYGDWPGVDDKSLHDDRDLAVTTDFRQVLEPILGSHLRIGDRQLAVVLPGAPSPSPRLASLLKA